MKTQRFLKTTLGVGTALAVAVLVGMLVSPQRGQARDEGGDEAKSLQGLAIAPVPLNLAGKDLAMVGLGSYLVNAAGDCNGCHSADVTTEFAPGGNPFFSQPRKVNPATYLGGGRDFGPLTPAPNAPHIISRNLTPDNTGMPEGGHSFEDFLMIMTTGTDLDHLHPTCSATVTTNCLTPPFNGDLLQIMPWASLKDMTRHDLRAIYEYLSAIPCISGPKDPNDPLHNNCP